MMKKCVLPSLVLFAAAVCLPSTGWAMNSGAHLYVTEEVFGFFDPDLAYGSAAPDLSLYVDPPVLWETGFDDTHYNYVVLWPQGWTEPWKRFTLGWMVHNEQWGADYPSHITYPLDAGVNNGGYVNQKAAFLVPAILPYIDLSLPEPVRLALAGEIAHNAIEFAIDFLIQNQPVGAEPLDEDLGLKLFTAAYYRSDEDIRRLFNILVARGKVTDAETLYGAEDFFRGLILYFSEALIYTADYGLYPLAVLGSFLAYELYGIEIPEGDVLVLLEGAVGLCAPDFDQFLADAIDNIKDELGLE
ncbi:MAG: hypothetical protein JSV26_04885 [bacterium]|nr:MAG: hypothetical protein JSV26_04885 [bacterium]